MIELWVKDHKHMVMRKEPTTEWRLKWNDEWGCWTVAGWSLFQLLEAGWKEAI